MRPTVEGMVVVDDHVSQCPCHPEPALVGLIAQEGSLEIIRCDAIAYPLPQRSVGLPLPGVAGEQKQSLPVGIAAAHGEILHSSTQTMMQSKNTCVKRISGAKTQVLHPTRRILRALRPQTMQVECCAVVLHNAVP